MEELAEELLEQKQVQASLATIWRKLQAMGLRHKKTAFAAEQDRPDVAELREKWKVEQGDWDASKLVFIDETGLNTKMASLYGWEPSSQRCVAKAPHGHWKSSTFVGALRSGGIRAPWLVDAAMNEESFLAYVKTQLAPSLSEGDMVVCDNLSSHKVVGVREAIEAAGAKLVFLPAYSPDLNPIEIAFSKLKTLLPRPQRERSRPYLRRSPQYCQRLRQRTARHFSGTPDTRLVKRKML